MNFYNHAALVLDHLDKYPGSVKGSLAASGVAAQITGGEAKRVLALVIETLKYKPVLSSLLEITTLQPLERLTFPRKTPPRTPSSASLLLVLLHDLLFSPKKRIEASDKWAPKEAVMRHQARLRAELVRVQIKAGKSRVEELAKSQEGTGCRYVRWNPNVALYSGSDSTRGSAEQGAYAAKVGGKDKGKGKGKGKAAQAQQMATMPISSSSRRTGSETKDWSLGALHAHLQKRGFTFLPEPTFPIPAKSYIADPHLGAELLVFNGKTNWWVEDEWYESGAVILQDKASCMPAKVLMQGWTEGEGSCIDGTAAPGNKTSYMSALAPSAAITAFERDAKRFKTLEVMMKKGQCRNVMAVQGDFLETNPTSKEWAEVTRILLDPSCSGSGIVNRLDYLVDNDAESAEADEVKAQRLEKLAAFQLQMILHAFKFPAVKRIAYSTCSIHPEEDEQVVLSALESKAGQEGRWTLAPREEVLPTWERRGRPEHLGGKQDLADSVIRCLPEDQTNGFFVSCFVRQESSAGASQGPPRKRKRGEGKASAIEAGDGDGVELDGLQGADENSAEVPRTVKVKSDAERERMRRKKAAQAERKRQKVGDGVEG